MHQLAETVRVYLDTARRGVAICIHCATKHPIDMTKYTEKCLGKRPLKAKCSACQKTFGIHFDFRRYQRIPTFLLGEMVHIKTGRTMPQVTIVSLSVGGLEMQLPEPAGLQVGEAYTLTCRLDDQQRSLISETITVVWIQGHRAGARFYPQDKYNCDLDFYVLSRLYLPDRA